MHLFVFLNNLFRVNSNSFSYTYYVTVIYCWLFIWVLQTIESTIYNIRRKCKTYFIANIKIFHLFRTPTITRIRCTVFHVESYEEIKGIEAEESWRPLSVLQNPIPAHV